MDDEGAYKVAEIIYNIHENNDIRSTMIKFENELIKYNAFRQMLNSHEYGHYNYALISFCIEKGYVNSIHKMINNSNISIMYHSDSANVSIENNNLDALKLFIETLGDVNIDNSGETLKCLDKYEDLAEYLREIIIKNGFYTCIGPSNYYKENYVTIKNLNKVNIQHTLIKHLFNGKYLLKKIFTL